jgi:hypothetical protein
VPPARDTEVQVAVVGAAVADDAYKNRVSRAMRAAHQAQAAGVAEGTGAVGAGVGRGTAARNSCDSFRLGKMILTSLETCLHVGNGSRWAMTPIDDKNKRVSIYTLHVHPNGTRLATGGLGKATCSAYRMHRCQGEGVERGEAGSTGRNRCSIIYADDACGLDSVCAVVERQWALLGHEFGRQRHIDLETGQVRGWIVRLCV